MKRFFVALSYLVLIFVLVIGLFVWLDYLELVSVRTWFAPLGNIIGKKDTVKVDKQAADVFYLENLRLGKERQSLALYEASLRQKEETLKEKEIAIKKNEESVIQREKALEEKEKTLNQRINMYEDKMRMIEQNAITLRNMPPNKAASILENYDDQLLIDTLRVTEVLAKKEGVVSVVPLWLSLLPPDRAAAVQRKMTIKPEN